jgi:signal transduction histidine kinase
VLYVKLAYDEALHTARTAQAAAANIIGATVESTLKPLESEIYRYAKFPWAEVEGAELLRIDEMRSLMSRHDVVQRVDIADLVAKRYTSISRGNRASSGELDAQNLQRLSEVAVDRIGYSRVLYVGNVPYFELTIRDTRRTSIVSRYSLDMRFLSEALATALAADVGATMVIDEQGSILAHSDASLAIMRVSFVADPRNRDWIAESLRGAQTALAKVNLHNGAAAYAASSRLPRFGWIVVALQNESQALQPVRRAVAWSLGSAFFAASVASLLAWLLSRHLTKPVSLLETGAARIAAGDLTHQLEVKSDDELGALARAFNTMSMELTRSYGDLERRVQEKTADLAGANARLEAASKNKSDFLAHMSHELRTPLNAIIGFSEMLRAQYFGPLNDKQLEYATDINAAGQHLLSLINDVLDLAKVEAGRLDFQPAKVDVVQAVENCRTLVSEQFLRKNQRLEIEVEVGATNWWLDDRKFRQCLLNLLSNASKFTPDGGAITTRVFVMPEALVVVVRDSGIGIPAAALPRLFEEFCRAGNDSDADNDAATKGTGLGLALTRRLVELHGGRIDVESELGKGSAFTMRFPRGDMR